MKSIVVIVLLLILSLNAEINSDKNDINKRHLIQIDINEINSFNFDDLKKDYSLNMKFCIGSSICVFEMVEKYDIEVLFKDISRYGKVKIYRDYRLKTY